MNGSIFYITCLIKKFYIRGDYLFRFNRLKTVRRHAKISAKVKKIKIGYYNREDWDRFINIIDDKESMHSNWEDWNQAFNKLKAELANSGFEISEVVVDMEKLIEYCKGNRLKNTGATRSQFIQKN